jgi:hypothetical protein
MRGGNQGLSLYFRALVNGTGGRMVMQAATPATPMIIVDYANGRLGIAEPNPAAFGLSAESGATAKTAAVDIRRNFQNTDGGFVPGLLEFLATGKSLVPGVRTVAILAPLDAGTRAMGRPRT